MRQVFVFETVAVVVGPWWEPPGDPAERGARVEVRARTIEPPRGSFAAAQRIVVDEPLFRADLFDRTDGPPGNLRAAHFHEVFDGVEPGDRVWPDALKADPIGWLCAELGDLDRIVARSGVPVATADGDAEAVRAACPAIAAAVETAWAAARS
jgi:hypothetical protein